MGFTFIERKSQMLTERKKRQYLIKIIKSYLTTSIDLMSYYKAVADTRKAKLVCNKSMKSLEQALVRVDQIKHVEILEYLYSSFVGNNVIAYSVSGTVVLSPKLEEYDKDEHIEEFKEMLEQDKKDREEKLKERQETLEAVRKAKEEGKKVEMVYDKTTKTTRPMIIDKEK